jgi:hypothetical protein
MDSLPSGHVVTSCGKKDTTAHRALVLEGSPFRVRISTMPRVCSEWEPLPASSGSLHRRHRS